MRSDINEGGSGRPEPATETSNVEAPKGGVMTNDVGVISGELTIETRSGEGGTDVIATYVGSTDRYIVSGSPVGSKPSHQEVVAHLTKDRGTGPDGNPQFTDLTDLPGASAPVDPGDEGTLG